LERYRADGVPAERLHWLPVWVDGVPATTTAEHQPPERLAIVYAGNLGPSQQLTTLVEAAALLRAQGSPVVVDIYGVGSAEGELRALAAARGADNVHFHGRVSPADAYAISSRSLAQVVSLKKTPLFRMTVPSKLYFCFAAGTPILAGLEGESAELARESGAAFVFDVEEPATLVQAVQTVLAMSDDARRACRSQVQQFFQDRFAKHQLIRHYLTLIDGCLSAPAYADAASRAASRASLGNA